jgi:formate dehydrogenase (NADP+) alpha subunit
MSELTLNIDGKEVKAKSGSTVLKAAQDAGIYIPTLCYHPTLPPYGGCRLCIVEIDGMRGLPPSCTTPATDKMVVHTQSPQLQKYRRNVIELLLTQHPHPCLICYRKEHCKPGDICLRNVSVTERCVLCPKNKRCEFQTVVEYVGLREVTLPYIPLGHPVLKDSPFFERDYNLCILCGRCVQTCQEVRGAGAIAFVNRGPQTVVGTAFGLPLKDVGCQSCGACVDVCPTGSLMEVAAKWVGAPERTVRTICPYCGVGCTLNMELKDGKIFNSRPALDGEANRGQACVKGRFGIIDVVYHPERLKAPLIRRNGHFAEASWEEALQLVATNLSKYRGNEVGVFSSAKCTNEENYLIQKFARTVLDTNHVDHCARLCHSPSVAGLAQSFGSGAMTNPIAEIGNARTILAVGSNTCAAHPVISLEYVKAVRQGAKLVVVNPREIHLCRMASLWLRNRPGTDVALLMGMMRAIVDEGLVDTAFVKERCEDYDAFKASLEKFPLDLMEKITWVSQDKIREAARIYATQTPATIIYAMGITQHTHGTDNVLALANLAMLTGNIGKPFTGVNPLRGQNNVQGACDMGALPDVYTGYQKVTNSQLREKFEATWGVKLNSQPGLTLTEIIDSAQKGGIKALYIVGENAKLSEPCADHCEIALAQLKFLVVQDIFLTETAKLADVVLPAASAIEKDGTFTNTERRVQRIRKVIEPLGDSRPDWWIICELARKMGASGFDFEHPAEIMKEIASLTPSYAGITYERLDKRGIQWPCPSLEHPGTPVLHTDMFTRGKGKFVPLEYKPSAELPDDTYPLILTTERSLYQYHTGTMTRKVPGLNACRPEELVEMNPADASKLGIADGEMVKVISRRGEVTARAEVTSASPPGVICMTFHFSESATNILTNSAVDPVAKIPELKVCAVRVEKVAIKV